MGGTTTDTASFSAINSYYSGLVSDGKTLQAAKFTPTKFQVQDGGILAVVNGNREGLTKNTYDLIDFV